MKIKSKLVLCAVVAIGVACVVFAADEKCLSFSLKDGERIERKCKSDAESGCSGNCKRWTTAVGGEPTCLWCFDCNWLPCSDCGVFNGFAIVVNQDKADCGVIDEDCECVDWEPANPPQANWMCYISGFGPDCDYWTLW